MPRHAVASVVGLRTHRFDLTHPQKQPALRRDDRHLVAVGHQATSRRLGVEPQQRVAQHFQE